MTMTRQLWTLNGPATQLGRIGERLGRARLVSMPEVSAKGHWPTEVRATIVPSNFRRARVTSGGSSLLSSCQACSKADAIRSRVYGSIYLGISLSGTTYPSQRLT
jgi:hypothetical protein